MSNAYSLIYIPGMVTVQVLPFKYVIIDVGPPVEHM